MEEGFPSGYEAIRWAVQRVNTPIIDGPNIWLLGRKTAPRDMMPTLNQWEKLAEAALILKIVERSCNLKQKVVLMSYFSGGSSDETMALAQYIGSELNRDRWFVRDSIIGWGRGSPPHSSEWWGKKYGVNLRTIQRWSMGVRRSLDDIFSSALSNAEDALKESGHVA